MLTPIVNKYINKVLGKLTKMLSDETTTALKANLGESAGVFSSSSFSSTRTSCDGTNCLFPNNSPWKGGHPSKGLEA